MSEEESEPEETQSNSSYRSSSSSSDDDNEPIAEDINEKDFLKTLSYLKNKDPQIYDKNVEFFSQDEGTLKKKIRSNKVPSDKPVYIKDYIKDFDYISDDEQSAEDPPLLPTYVEEQKALKESFKSIMKDESSDDESSSSLLKKKEKDEKEKQEEDKDYIQWLKGKKQDLNDKQVENELKPLHDFWNNPELDEKEEFLKDYILNKRYLKRDDEENYEDSGDLSEDEKLLVEQDDFEQNYNHRFDNEDNTNIKRYPRKIEGSLRRKDDARKKKREEIQKRKTEEKQKKKLEIKKKQKEKLNEVKEKIQQIKELTGNADLGFEDDEIMEDFDPDKHDKKMQELFNEKFYSEGIEDKPDFSGDNENWNLDDINMDCEAEESDTHKETRSKRKRRKKKSTYQDICDVVKPVFDPEKHSSFQKYIEEYYNLDCEDFIDDIPCRFKYREVVPNDYGLSVEEILMAEDKELNRWVSAKKICKLRPTHVEKNEVKIYKQKGKDEHLKVKLLPSLYDEDEDEDEETGDRQEKTGISTEPSGSDIKISKNINMNNKKLEPNHRNIQDMINVNATVKKKSKFKKQSPNALGKNDPISKISDNRLIAYNIKPKQFRSKLQHSK